MIAIPATTTTHAFRSPWTWLALALLLTAAIYWPGISGGWLFDDYSSIVSNHALQITDLRLPSLINAALSSTASAFKRPRCA